MRNCLRGGGRAARMRDMFRAEDFLDLHEFAYPELFANCEHVWDALKKLPAFVKKHVKPSQRGKIVGTPFIGDDVQIGEGTVIEHGAVIKGPAIIGKNCEIRSGAYIRGNVIVGEGCVLGNACEFKNCLLLDGVQVPHFSYVGDSILGNGAHLGAGVICSNLRLDQKNIVVRAAGAVFDTGLRKFGAIVGDRAEVGCNAVLNPGTLLGPRSLVMPAMAFSGHLPAATIAHTRATVTFLPRRD